MFLVLHPNAFLIAIMFDYKGNNIASTRTRKSELLFE